MKIIDRKKISSEAWDTMVWNDKEALFYNLSWVLDTLCPDWVAVMKGDYEGAIAIPVQRKMTVRYTYNPFLFHRASVIGNLSTDEVDEAVWMAAKYVDLRTRERMEGSVEWVNCVLNLSKNHLDLVQSYSSNAKRNLKKASKHNLEFMVTDSAALISFFFKENVSFGKLGIKEKEYENFEKLMIEAFDCEIGRGFAVEYNEEVVACGFWIEFNGRLTFVKGTSSEVGRDCGAMQFLFDRVISQFSSSSLTLDFAGSNVESVAQFYKSFGAIEEPIYHLKRNNLPFPLNQIKK
ncbi:MAG: hypothetical protein JKY54_09290 [Flavobacteriales bacterium]|nr:hypothetical protein [Flavobacteriales bacterium]